MTVALSMAGPVGTGGIGLNHARRGTDKILRPFVIGFVGLGLRKHSQACRPKVGYERLGAYPYYDRPGGKLWGLQPCPRQVPGAVQSDAGKTGAVRVRNAAGRRRA